MKPGQSKLEYLWVNLSRPLIMLTRSFICFILSLYMSLCVSFPVHKLSASNAIYIPVCMVSSLPLLFLRDDFVNKAIRYFLLDVRYLCTCVHFFFPLHNAKRAHSTEFFKTTYGFGPGVGGLAYTGLGLGFVLATIFGAKWADQVYKYVRFSFNILRDRLTDLISACRQKRRQGQTGDADPSTLFWLTIRPRWALVSPG